MQFLSQLGLSYNFSFFYSRGGKRHSGYATEQLGRMAYHLVQERLPLSSGQASSLTNSLAKSFVFGYSMSHLLTMILSLILLTFHYIKFFKDWYSNVTGFTQEYAAFLRHFFLRTASSVHTIYVIHCAQTTTANRGIKVIRLFCL